MMSVAACKWAIGLRSLPHREKCVLFVLAWHANSKTQRCNPSTRTIAAEAGMSRNTVDLALDELHRLRQPGTRSIWTAKSSSPVAQPLGHGVAQPLRHLVAQPLSRTVAQIGPLGWLNR
jgi:hypothetical protein